MGLHWLWVLWNLITLLKANLFNFYLIIYKNTSPKIWIYVNIKMWLWCTLVHVLAWPRCGFGYVYGTVNRGVHISVSDRISSPFVPMYSIFQKEHVMSSFYEAGEETGEGWKINPLLFDVFRSYRMSEP